MVHSIKTQQKSFIVLLFLLLAAGIYIVYPFIYTIVLSLVFAILFYPLHEKYLLWTKGRQNMAAALSVFSVIFFLLVPIAFLVTLITTQLAALSGDETSALNGETLSSLLKYVQEKASLLAVKVEGLVGLHANLSVVIKKEMQQLGLTLSKYSPRVAMETANFFLHCFIMVTVLYYLFRDGKRFFSMMVHITPIKDQYEHKLASEIKLTINGIFYGSFLRGLIQATLATLGFYLVGMKGYLVWGAITFFMSFLPVLGTGVVTMVTVLILLLQGNIKPALFLLIYGAVVVGGSDNLSLPFLVQSNMHPLLLFLSIFGGLAVFGPLGLLLGPMLMAMLDATVRIYEKDF